MQRYLADTAAWIEHLRFGDRELDARLRSETIVMHEFVIGELQLGSLGRGVRAPWELFDLDLIPSATHDETVELVRRHKLEGSGVGWVDAHLLAAAMLSGVKILTRDRAMQGIAARIGLI